MKFGFIKTRAASPALKVGDVEFNLKQILSELQKAENAGIELLVFPELSLTGYTCGDLFLQKHLLDNAARALKKLVDASKESNALFFVGLPFAVGADLYNCAAAIQGGKLLALIPKTHLPNYNEFYERRYFKGADGNFTVEFAGKQIPFGINVLLRCETNPAFTVAAEICEDLWVALPPSCAHALAGANIVVNLSASNELVGKADYRRLLLKSQSAKLCCGYVYADAGSGESTSDMVFAGHNLIAENGVILKETTPFSGEYADSEIDLELLENERRRLNTFEGKAEGYTIVAFSAKSREGALTRRVEAMPFVPQGKELEKRAGAILSMQSAALARRLEHIGAKTAVLGVSGGLDSSLALLVTVRAFDLLKKDRADILAVTMPGFGTSHRTRNNSVSLAGALGVTLRSVPIGGTVTKHLKDIEHDIEEKNVTYENAQARYRTIVLMDLANETNGIVIGTGDLSELALGWCTYNGDHMSMYSVNGSVPKTLVKSLVSYEAERIGGRAEVVLKSVLLTEISPELLPPDESGEIAQKTEDIVGPYELHDFYLYQFVRRGFSPEKTLYLSRYAFGEKYDAATRKKWLVNFYQRFFAQQFKRDCVPDGVKVGSVSLSPRADWRMPSDASAALWIEAAQKAEE